ncbi:MAG: putative membrane protein [Candidatus Tokpelaia sp. JSC189]|nr:MAG: putative membrane protein [Candidatus Tokpelaia sp. JSC189]
MIANNTYLWIKAVHVIAVISWMAAMLYLPRLFIYHCRTRKDFSQSKTFKLMERRLLCYIMNPAMVIAWITGLWIAWKIYDFRGGWLHLKFIVVILLSAFHGFLMRATRHFAQNRNQLSEKSWRILNEVPTALIIIAVIAVIIKIPD